MAEVLTTKLKNDTIRIVYDDILNNEYYFAVSSITIDELSRVNAVNSLNSKTQFKENIVFGKKVYPEDIKFMIKYYPWQSDAVYDQYDDESNLEDKKFYAVVGPNNNDSGDYRVYKCLDNNNGAASISPPNYNAETKGQIYAETDGYVWKFMYYLTEQEFEAYNAVGYIPLEKVFDINPVAERFDPVANTNVEITGSQISDVIVENAFDNFGYPSVENGIIINTPNNDGTFLIRNANLSETSNFYSGMTIYITNKANEVSKSYIIDTYRWDENPASDIAKVRVIGDPLGDGIVGSSSFRIVPTIKLEGDGHGGEVVAIVTEGRVTGVEVLQAGNDYNNVTATVVDPQINFDPSNRNTIDVRAVLRPVLSPFGGHNFNLIDEMHCRNILMYAYITESDNNQIGQSNSYSAVGLIKNPEFAADPDNANTASPLVFDNRIQIITNDYGKVEVNTLVKQTDINNNKTFEGRVHAVQASSNSIFITSYSGPYTNQSNNDISFDYTKPLINETGQTLQINTPVANNVIESRYTQRSGTVYFMEDFVPLERSVTSREEYKLVLEF
jgi:hypothetical protein